MVGSYNRNVFINCPSFVGDIKFRPLFQAAIFTIMRCKFNVRCAEEVNDSGIVRLNNIYNIIADCKFGIHDLSRTELDKSTKLPRFNMPFELGVFLGAKRFGKNHNNKNCIIFENKPHSYEKYISDLKGHDIQAHQRKPKILISKIRHWLAANSKRSCLQGGTAIWREYQKFRLWLPGRCREEKIRNDELLFGDLYNFISEWIKKPITKGV